MDHRGRWFQAIAVSYGPDENGRWKGHWIGRVHGPGGKGRRSMRGLSFASRRRGRVWAFWIGREAPKAPPWESRVAIDIERCGWRVQRAYSTLPGRPDAVRVSGHGLSFFLPVDLYDDCDDADFAAVCEAERQMIGSRP